MNDAHDDMACLTAEDVAKRDTASSIKKRVAKLLASVAILATFFGFGYWAFMLASDRRWVFAAFALCISLMAIPFAAFDAPLQERIESSLVMPFVLAGLVLSILAYFQMFRFGWFESLFNDKGAGPLGLIVSAFIGITAGGYLGWRVLCAIPGTVHCRRYRSEIAQRTA